jgi:hypothetical protein
MSGLAIADCHHSAVIPRAPILASVAREHTRVKAKMATKNG